MAKIIRLSENDLIKLVERVIQEQKVPTPKPINIRATEGSSPEAKISLEKGKKILHVSYETGLNSDQKFVVETEFPATQQPKGVFVVYKGNNVFLIGKNKIPAKVVAQL